MTQPYVIDEMISAKTIAARIEDLCREIKATYGDEEKLVDFYSGYDNNSIDEQVYFDHLKN